jgi:hypothetical protein
VGSFTGITIKPQNNKSMFFKSINVQDANIPGISCMASEGVLCIARRAVILPEAIKI